MNSKRSQTGIFILLFMILGFLIWFPIHPSLVAEGLPEEDVFSIRTANKPLREVLKNISEASGYEIRFNNQLADERVSIQLDNVTLKEAITRVLQPYNHVAVWDEKNKKIGLFIFDNKNPPVSITGVNRIFELATETTAGP